MASSANISPVYLLAGIYGERSDLAEFRRKLSSEIQVEIVELQSLEEPVAQLTDMKAIGAALAQEINRRSPDGYLRLAGYSFGGTAAFEAARYLIDSGRRVCFLGIIDGIIRPRPIAHSAPNNSRSERFLQLLSNINATRYEGLSGFIYRSARLAYRLLREFLGRFCSSDTRLGYVRSIIDQLSPKPAAFVRRMLLFHFRMRAMERWQPDLIHGPVFVAISQEFSSWINHWNSLCPQAGVVVLPGEHVRVLEPPLLDILCSEFSKAVQDADCSSAMYG